MGDIRIAKFETLIEDVNNEIKKRLGLFEVMSGIGDIFGTSVAISSAVSSAIFPVSGRHKFNTSLALIYDYDKLNEYAKVIMDKSSILLTDGDRFTEAWATKHTNVDEFKNSKVCIDAAKDFIQYCRNGQNETEGYKFIFWALMILSVDKTDAEEHLSLICDFARMLRISGEELEDIIYVIKTIYDEVTTEYVFKSEIIPSIFRGTFNLYHQN